MEALHLREVECKEEGKSVEIANQHRCVSVLLVCNICEEWEIMGLIKYVLCEILITYVAL